MTRIAHGMCDGFCPHDLGAAARAETPRRPSSTLMAAALRSACRAFRAQRQKLVLQFVHVSLLRLQLLALHLQSCNGHAGVPVEVHLVVVRVHGWALGIVLNDESKMWVRAHRRIFVRVGRELNLLDLAGEPLQVLTGT